MAELKTKPESASVDDFLNAVEDKHRREDSFAMLQLMKKLTGVEPVMWGTAIVGFGTYRYQYASGREGEWLTIGFSPRKAALTLYGLVHYEEGRDYVAKLGEVTTGKGCIYVKDLSKVDKDTLTEMITVSFKQKNGSLFTA